MNTINLTVVGAKPTVSVSASPTSVPAGSSSVVKVTATNAATVTLTGSDGSSYTLKATGGSETVKPTATTTYTATAVGVTSTVTAMTTVTVTIPAPTVSFKANPDGHFRVRVGSPLHIVSSIAGRSDSDVTRAS